MFKAIGSVIALVVILIGAALFPSAVETLGSRSGMRRGAVGGLLAAVGTALPESMIAIAAIMEPVVTGGAGGGRHDRDRGDPGRDRLLTPEGACA